MYPCVTLKISPQNPTSENDPDPNTYVPMCNVEDLSIEPNFRE